MPADDGARDLEHEKPGVDAAGEEEAADEDHQPGDAELGEQRLARARRAASGSRCRARS